jgi:hypothetical protein
MGIQYFIIINITPNLKKIEIMLAFIKAKIWSGSGWLLALCVILSVVVVIYFSLHLCYKGTDHKQLSTTQLTNLDNVFAEYPDVTSTPIKNDSIAKQRESRNNLITEFLESEYNSQTDTKSLKQLDSLLLGFNNKDTKQYLSNHDIIVHDFFWFVGQRSYLEVLMWALVGVLVSLIYYVSLANGTAVKQAGDTDSGTFDVSGISVQVARMFYAPICALVLVLGYNLLNSDNKMTDISIGKGLLLFSFICGFFSGRVIKFIDRLKDLVLPVSDGPGGTAPDPKTPSGGNSSDTTGGNKTSGSTDPSNTADNASTTDTTATKTDNTSTDSTSVTSAATGTPDTSTEVAVVTQPDATTATETAQVPAVTAANITVSLQLSPAASQSADGPDIIEGGFNSAVVTLQAAEGGNVITLTPPANDQGDSFTAKDLPLGKYTLLANMAYKKGNSIINLSASQTLSISNATESVDLSLDITPANG